MSRQAKSGRLRVGMMTVNGQASLTKLPASQKETAGRNCRYSGGGVRWRFWQKKKRPAVRRVSDGYVVLDQAEVRLQDLRGWHEAGVVEWQWQAYQKLIRKMYAGEARADLRSAAEAIRLTGLEDPLILEVGCGSGYYEEILSHLLGKPLRYVGLDFSPAMVLVGRQHYRDLRLLSGDATALPFGDGAFDIVFNGGALMHIFDYEKTIAESRRASRGWCIFYTVVVREQGPTTVMRKQAYGGPTVEVVFRERELLEMFERAGLRVRSVLEGIPYNLEKVLGEPTKPRTYVCEISG